jgi:hypothetical protein
VGLLMRMRVWFGLSIEWDGGGKKLSRLLDIRSRSIVDG